MTTTLSVSKQEQFDLGYSMIGKPGAASTRSLQGLLEFLLLLSKLPLGYCLETNIRRLLTGFILIPGLTKVLSSKSCFTWNIKFEDDATIDRLPLHTLLEQGEQLKEIDIARNVTTIGESSFRGCKKLTKVIIPDSVTSIGDFAFYGCSSLTEIIIPDSVTTIGRSAFNGCFSLTEVIIPDSVTTISDYAFVCCFSLAKITIPNSVTHIGDHAFNRCSAKIIIPDSVTSLGKVFGKNKNKKKGTERQRAKGRQETQEGMHPRGQQHVHCYSGNFYTFRTPPPPMGSPRGRQETVDSLFNKQLGFKN